MIKSLTHEQAKAIALKNNMPICLCGCKSPTRQVMEFYWDIANAIKKLNEENDAEIERLRDENKRLRDDRMQIAHRIIEDEARISKARRYVVRVDNKALNGTEKNDD